MRSFLKNEKGLTLIELLAVIIILGILMLITIPIVGTIIENSRKDAYLADAEMMVRAARLAQVNGEKGTTVGGKEDKKAGFYGGIYYTLKDLVDKGYLGNIKNEYESDRSVVVCYNGTYSVRLIHKEPHSHQVIPKKGAKRETPILDTQLEKYIENRSMAFHGSGGMDSVALIEDVRGNRDIVRLPPN